MKLADILPLPDTSGGDEPKTYSCAELSKIIGRHPNTLRKYESWGFIGTVPRKANGYRRYTRALALQALFSVTALRACFQDWQGRRRVKALIADMLAERYETVLSGLDAHRAALEKSLEEAVAARAILESWKTGRSASEEGPQPGTEKPGVEKTVRFRTVFRSEAAKRIGVAADTLRDWERNGLAAPARLGNGRRVYVQADLEKLAVVRVLRQADYSLMGIVNLFGGKTSVEDLSFARDRWDETLRGLIDDSVLLREITLESSGPILRSSAPPSPPQAPPRSR